MVRNSIFIFCLCVCFCQYHISVSLYTHLYTHIINKLLHGWFVCTIFIIHSLWRIAKLTRSLRSLVRLTILHNSWIKIVRTHQPWSNLYISYVMYQCSEVEIGKTRNCVEARRSQGGVFSYNSEFCQFLQVLRYNCMPIWIKHFIVFFYNIM